MEAQNPASHWVNQVVAFYVCFVFFLCKHMLTGFVSSLWYGNDWKYTLHHLIKDLCQKGEQLCHLFEHISQEPREKLKPGLMGCSWTRMLADGPKAEASVWGSWPQGTLETPMFQCRLEFWLIGFSLVAEVWWWGAVWSFIHPYVAKSGPKTQHLTSCNLLQSLQQEAENNHSLFHHSSKSRCQ